jgi:alginate O-acetyltransferase complex protein AlgI
VYLLTVVMVGWVFFRADTLSGAVAFLGAMAGRGAVAPTPFTVQWYLTPELWLALAAGIAGSLPVGPALTRLRDRVVRGSERSAASWGFAAASTGAMALVLVASIMQIAARTYNPFIYFRF